MWLRADRPGVPLVNGQSVTQWSDYAGQGANAVAPSASQAPKIVLGSSKAGGLPVIRFDGSNDQLGFDESNVLLERPFTVFLLSRYNENDLRREVLQGIQERFIICHYYSSVGLYVRSQWMYQSSIDSGKMYDFQLCVAQIRRDYNGFRWQGEEKAMVRSYLNEPLGLSMGGLGYANSPSAVDVAEMILYRRELSTQEIINVENFLAAKWGLKSILPEGHAQAFVPYGYASAADAESEAAMLRTAEQQALTGDSSGSSGSVGSSDATSESDLSSLAPTGGNELDTDVNPVIAPIANQLGTVDFFHTRRLQDGMDSEPWKHVTWGRRSVIGLDESSLISLKVNIRRQPLYAGVALQILLVDASGRDRTGTSASAVPAYHSCFRSKTDCGTMRVMRLCLNGNARPGACDDVQELPLRTWRTVTIPVAQKFRAIYGSSSRVPTAVAMFLAASAPYGVSEVYLDDLNVIQLNGSTVLAPGTDAEAAASGNSNQSVADLPLASSGDCPQYNAYSLSGASRSYAASLRATLSGNGGTFSDMWTTRSASGSLAATVLSAGSQPSGSTPAQDQVLKISGTVPTSASSFQQNLLLSAAGGLANSEVVKQTIGNADPRQASAVTKTIFSSDRIETISVGLSPTATDFGSDA